MVDTASPHDERLLNTDRLEEIRAITDVTEGVYTSERWPEFLQGYCDTSNALIESLDHIDALTEQLSAAEGQAVWRRDVPTEPGWYWIDWPEPSPLGPWCERFSVEMLEQHQRLGLYRYAGPLTPPAPARATDS